MLHLKREENKLSATINGETKTATLRPDNRWVFNQTENFTLGNGKTNFSISLAFMGTENEKSISIIDLLATAKTKTATATAGTKAKTKTATSHEKTMLNLETAFNCVKSKTEMIENGTATIKDLEQLKGVFVELLPKYAPQKMDKWVEKTAWVEGKIEDLKKAEALKKASELAEEEKIIASLLDLI